jgi:hypothetical protein
VVRGDHDPHAPDTDDALDAVFVGNHIARPQTHAGEVRIHRADATTPSPSARPTGPPDVHAVLISATLFALLSLPPGCSSAESDHEEATATATSALQEHSQAGITDGVTNVDGPLAPDPEQAAQAIVDHHGGGLQPDGCATKTRAGSVVTFVVRGCTGPFGKVVLQGTLTATITKPSDDLLHVDIVTSGDMTANGAHFEWAAGVDVKYDGDARDITYHGHSSGTTKRGIAFSRHTDLTAAYDAKTKCLAIDGVSKGTIGRFDLDLELDGFKGCPAACPSAGVAKATLRGPLGHSDDLKVTFDGGDAAHVVGPRRSFDVKLACADAESAE